MRLRPHPFKTFQYNRAATAELVPMAATDRLLTASFSLLGCCMGSLDPRSSIKLRWRFPWANLAAVWKLRPNLPQ